MNTNPDLAEQRLKELATLLKDEACLKGAILITVCEGDNTIEIATQSLHFSKAETAFTLCLALRGLTKPASNTAEQNVH